MSTPTATAIWADYQRRLVVLQPIREHRHAQLEQRDANDMPFYAVFREASGEALLTVDNDLLDTIEEAITAAELMNLLRDYARQKAVALGASGQIYVGAIGISYGGSLLVRAAKAGLSAFKQLPSWAQLGIVVGGVWLAQRPGLRAWVGQRWEQLSSAVDTALPRLAEAVGDVVTAENAAQTAHAEIRSRIRKTKRIGLRAALLRVTRDAGVALQLRELATRVEALGYRSTARRFHDYLEAYLERDPMFEKTLAGWQLRRHSE